MKKKSNTASRLKEIMNENNYKQVDILKMAKPFCEKYNTPLNKNDLSQYVSGKIEPGQKKIMILAECLNVNPSWLMGLDVPKKSQNSVNQNNLTLEQFLKNIKFDEIEQKVKEDTKYNLISYIDFYDILLYIYPNKFNLLEKEHDFFEEHLENIESVVDEIKKIQEKNPNIKINSNIKLEDLEETILSSKKNKLYYSIKKYYNKTDILKEIDKRNYFKICDNFNKPIIDEKTRLNVIEELIEDILKNLKTQ